jgi:hypothetical protein
MSGLSYLLQPRHRMNHSMASISHEACEKIDSERDPSFLVSENASNRPFLN